MFDVKEFLEIFGRASRQWPLRYQLDVLGCRILHLCLGKMANKVMEVLAQLIKEDLSRAFPAGHALIPQLNWLLLLQLWTPASMLPLEGGNLGGQRRLRHDFLN